MRIARRLAIALLAAFSLIALVPATASAAPDYAQQVATALQTNPVYVDKAAQPTIKADQASLLTTQIQSSGLPIYLVLMDNAQTKNYKNPAVFMDAVHQDLGKDQPALIALSYTSVKANFYANGYDEPRSLSNGAGAVANDVVQHYRDPFQVYQEWIAGLTNIQVDTGAPSNQNQQAQATSSKQDNGLPTWEIVMIVIAGIFVMVMIIALVVAAVRRRQRRSRTEERKRSLHRLTSALETDLYSLDGQIELHRHAKGAHTSALTNIGLAREALSAGDLDDAEKHLMRAQQQYEQALTIVEDHEDLPKNHEERASDGALKVRDGNGKTRVINQQTVVVHQAQQPGFGNYWEGGYYSGLYWAPGWYADPFWNWMLLDSMIAYDDSWVAYEQGYGQGFDQGLNAGDQQGTTDGGSYDDQSSSPNDDPVIDEGTPGGGSYDDSGTDQSGADQSNGWDNPNQSGSDTPNDTSGDSWSNASQDDSGSQATTDSNSWDAPSNGSDSGSYDTGSGSDSGGFDSSSGSDWN